MDDRHDGAHIHTYSNNCHRSILKKKKKPHHLKDVDYVCLTAEKSTVEGKQGIPVIKNILPMVTTGKQLSFMDIC